MSEWIAVEQISEHTLVFKLNRPEAANALSLELLHQLNGCLDRIQADDLLNCLIITGSGSKAFCAGADLKERREMNGEQVKSTVKLIGDTFRKIESLPMPTIAAINGAAFGGGLELALACDLRVISKNAKVGLTETSLAIIPGGGGTQRLPRLIGKGMAKKMIFEAKPVTAEKAFSLGIAEELVEAEELMPAALSIADNISGNGPIALRLAKKAIEAGLETSLESGLQLEHELYLQTLHTEDRIEGLQAFKEKRKPCYKGK
ncbi:enoyl-CoA hydratase-related protein [Aciduricibacillus chroicocephali]|uniref:Enoyl-CoA hydratase-related protein n=1 Tax=Aciduricibacillus chroicocephali TaxID=3054939 RepID=A0ABY9KYD0_9BACI|nr:enoyl-CoA hydratase-related protein [Bacillaceae bacterium 44XB]